MSALRVYFFRCYTCEAELLLDLEREAVGDGCGSSTPLDRMPLEGWPADPEAVGTPAPALLCPPCMEYVERLRAGGGGVDFQALRAALALAEKYAPEYGLQPEELAGRALEALYEGTLDARDAHLATIRRRFGGRP